jgi:hypothetical protein
VKDETQRDSQYKHAAWRSIALTLMMYGVPLDSSTSSELRVGPSLLSVTDIVPESIISISRMVLQRDFALLALLASSMLYLELIP